MPEDQLSQVHQLQARGDLAGAIALCRRIVADSPQDARAVHVLGLLHFELGEPARAAELIGRSIELSPGMAEFHSNLAAVLGALSRHAEAATALGRAIQLNPRQPVAHYNLGMALEQLGRLAEAQTAYGRATRLAPDYAEPWAGLGDVLRKTGQMARAEEAYLRAVQLDLKQAGVQHELAKVSFLLGRTEEALARLRTYTELAPEDYHAHSGLLYRLHYLPGISREQMFQEHQAWAKRHAEPLRATWRAHENDRSPDRRLKISYVSPDFRRHSVATFFEPLLTHHDHNRFEIILYSSTPKPDELTARLCSKADGFVDIAKLSDEEAAERIRRDRVDILVDLTGHMTDHRLLVFARKPAPVQVTYVGHPDTTGLSAMDYRLTDPILDPPGGGRDAFYTEKLIRLPTIFGCYQAPDEKLPITPLPAGATGSITFGSLNMPGKITEEAIETWCEILHRVPQSRLVLLANLGAVAIADLFAKHGMDPKGGRLELRGRLSRLDYLKAFSQIDVALDTFPYNGQTTTCDGFWMGVPTIGLLGNSYVSRMAADLLHHVGLDDLVAHTPDEYVELAVRLASDRAHLAEIRHSLGERMRASTIMDGQSLARAIEATYRQMWARYSGM